MDLEILEALALSDDRTAALSHLLPGSEDHDYFRCVALLHAGALDDATAILDGWPERHGHTERYQTLALRANLFRLARTPEGAPAEQVRDWLGTQHWHEAEVAAVDPTRPTRIADGGYDGARILRDAVAYDANLSQVTDEGLYELLAADVNLDAARRRQLLSRISHTASPRLVALCAEDLAEKNTAFGQRAAHAALTLAQLHELLERRPELNSSTEWIAAVIRRLRPLASVDLELDLEARAAYLERLWAFVAPLPPVTTSLKVHVLYHALETARRIGPGVDVARFLTYLALPRATHYLPHGHLDRVRNDHVAQLAADFRNFTALSPVISDEALVRDLIARSLDRAAEYAPFFDRAWLDRELAASRLLAGAGDADRATVTLGPEAAAELRDRVEIAWVPYAPARFAEHDEVSLEVDVKNVPELVVKVFRVDPVAYFQHHRREISTDLDLDGLAASHEEILRFPEPPVRRVRRTIALPACARPGTYVVDLIGNGKSSRAVIYKGRLRFVERVGAAGHAITIVDELGAPRPDARAWVGDREYVPDARGRFAIPFSTNPGRTPMLLVAHDIATVTHVELQAETYALKLDLVVERESLTRGRTAKAIARIALACAGHDASLALVENATWDVSLVDRAGTPTTRSQPLVLADDRTAAVLEIPIPDDLAQIAVTVRGRVRAYTTQRDLDLAASASAEIARIDGTHATEALYLAETAAGWVVSALGKTGEPRAQRPVTITLGHADTNGQVNVELATDARGRIELGHLPRCARIAATLAGTTQTWPLELRAVDQWISTAPEREIRVPLPLARDAATSIARCSLVELRADVPHSHPRATLEPLAGAIAIRGLATGQYELRTPWHRVRIVVADVGAEVDGEVVGPNEIVGISAAPPAIAELVAGETEIRLVVRGASPKTRVHVIASRFVSALAGRPNLALRGASAVVRRGDTTIGAHYVSGRELGDEYRYILERRTAKRYPGLLLERPSLLLNPWARRATTTDVANAAEGGEFQRMAPPASRSYPSRAPAPQPAAGNDAGYPTYDFLPDAPAVLPERALAADGTLTLARSELGRATTVTILVDDPRGAAIRSLALAEHALDPRDLRLAIALDPARHATQQKQIAPLRAGETLTIADLATAKVHLVDSIERAHAYLLALRDDDTLREFAFVARWHALDETARREHYTKYACHELHLFLYFKDRAFFDAVVKPHLAHKRVPTFVDDFLLGRDLSAYATDPAARARLNAVELALLAHRLAAGDELARILGDRVAIQPPDAARDTRLIDALLGAGALDGDERISAATETATAYAKADMARGAAMPAMEMSMIGGASNGYAAAPMASPAPSPKPHKKKAMMKMSKSAAADADFDDEESTATNLDEAEAYRGDDQMTFDRRAREEAKPMFRAADKTQELAENNWWHLHPHEQTAELVAANKLWRELSVARPLGRQILSPSLGLAVSNFAEAMCALAITELPFVAAQHAVVADGPRLTITAAGNALAGTSQLVYGELVDGGPPLVVGQNYVRTDDRYDYATGEQVEKYLTGPLATGVVYTCTIVVANPSSSRQRVAALLQIPRGSLPIGGAKATRTVDVVLEPYGTHGEEYAFYFPAPGTFSHFGVHVSRDGKIVAAAPARALEVTSGATAADPNSWSHISQHGTVAEVVAHIATANLAAIDLSRAAWRVRERTAYDAIVGAVEKRHAYDDALWGYALMHGDLPRLRAYLRVHAEQLVASAGPIVEPFGLDAEATGAYEHLEYAPLINARAHRLGARTKILNDGFADQYAKFLMHVVHRAKPSSEDLLAAAAYFLAQDRYADATAALARVQHHISGAIADRMQHDYLAAFLACVAGEPARARELATRWRDVPVDRWSKRFAALIAMLDEAAGASSTPAILDDKSREQRQSEAAATQPAFDLVVDRDGVIVRSQHVPALELRYFEMDVELLFSRQPFVASDVSRFSFIEPGHRVQLAPTGPEQRVPWATQLVGKNVVVEGVGAGMRHAKVHYANDLAPTVAHQYGQVRVARASDRAALPATYVKVYAKKRGGEVAFYKDGYTDLRGWFDYASLSTTDLDDVDRFAILVCSDTAGAAILEAAPPAR